MLILFYINSYSFLKKVLLFIVFFSQFRNHGECGCTNPIVINWLDNVGENAVVKAEILQSVSHRISALI